MTSVRYKLVEFFIMFILIPVSFALPYNLIAKLSIGFIGFCYVIFILLKVENTTFKISEQINWTRFWKRTVLKLFFITIFTSGFVFLTDSVNLFQVVINKPLLWFIIVFVYSVFSVYPQELIYRTLFFQRYELLFKNKNLFIFVNAIIFSLAHALFRNPLVHILTFLGGIVFALTYAKTRSTLLVSMEHALYGSWLFTVGMGSMLGFPS